MGQAVVRGTMHNIGDDDPDFAADSSIEELMRRLQLKVQDFFVERETDGGGIHETYMLASMITVTPRQLNPLYLVTLEKIGAGQFGEVYRGELRRANSQATDKCESVAIKVLKNTDPSDNEVESFLGEAALMAQFDHPNILRVVGICGQDGLFKLVTEMAEHGSLEQYLKTQVLTELVRAKLATDIACGMQYLETCGFIHRDLASRNVLVAGDMSCRICDFGLSRQCGKENNKLADTEIVAVRWTAPEVIQSRLYTRKTDVWSFGIVLYELWTRASLPYGTTWTNSRVIREVRQGFRLTRPEDCSQEIYVLMMSCWHPEAALRPSFNQVKCRLMDILGAWSKSDKNTDLGFSFSQLQEIYAQSSMLSADASQMSAAMSPISESPDSTSFNNISMAEGRLAQYDEADNRGGSTPHMELDGLLSTPDVKITSTTSPDTNRRLLMPLMSPTPSKRVQRDHNRMSPPTINRTSMMSPSSPIKAHHLSVKPVRRETQIKSASVPVCSPRLVQSSAFAHSAAPSAYDSFRGTDMLEEPDEAWHKLDNGSKQAGVGRFARFSQRIRNSFVFSFKHKKRDHKQTHRHSKVTSPDIMVTRTHDFDVSCVSYDDGQDPAREPSYLIPATLRDNMTPEEVDEMAEILGQIASGDGSARTSPSESFPSTPMNGSQHNNTLIKHLNAKLLHVGSPDGDNSGAYLDLSLAFDDSLGGHSSPKSETNYNTYPPASSGSRPQSQHDISSVTTPSRLRARHTAPTNVPSIFLHSGNATLMPRPSAVGKNNWPDAQVQVSPMVRLRNPLRLRLAECVSSHRYRHSCLWRSLCACTTVNHPFFRRRVCICRPS